MGAQTRLSHAIHGPVVLGYILTTSHLRGHAQYVSLDANSSVSKTKQGIGERGVAHRREISLQEC